MHKALQRRRGLPQRMVQVTIGRDPTTGKLKRMPLYGKNRQEVAEKLSQVLHVVGQGTFVAPNRLTPETWLHTWVWKYRGLTLRPVTCDRSERLIR
jgi:integrase